MNPRLFLVLSWLLLYSTAFCQSGSPASSIPLQDVRYIPSNGLIGNGVSLNLMGRGAFYVQMITGGRLEDGVRRISFDGKDIQIFDVNRIIRPSYLSGRTPFIESFFVGWDGSVYLLARWVKDRVSDELTVLAFDRDGTPAVITPIPLEDNQILHFARFPDGHFVFLAGSDGIAGFDSVDLIFTDNHGKVTKVKNLRKLSEQEKQKAVVAMQKDASTSGSEPWKAASRPDHEMESLLSSSLLFSADDESVYLERSDKPNRVFSLSESGEITEIPLPGDEENDDLLGGSIHQNDLMLFYGKVQPAAGSPEVRKVQGTQIKIFDFANHEVVRTYSGDSRLSSLLVGWDDNMFYFLKYVKNAQPPGFEIVAATP